MDNKTISEQTCYSFDKRVDRYEDCVDNYVIPHELTVTITINEYRNLLQSKAKAEADEARREKWEKETRIKELEEEIKKLKAAIEALKNVPCNAEGGADHAEQ